MVTIKWWDGTWLKESFAEISAHLALSKMQDTFSIQLDNFKLYGFWNKLRGYGEDFLSTTHPIICDVEDTHQAMSVFDGITYKKGFGVLTQLYNLIGDEIFSQNIQAYFEEFKWKCTQIEDLMRHLNKNFDQVDLTEWMKVWLGTAGTNVISAEWNPSQQGPQVMTLKQASMSAEHHTLRPHKFKIGFFGADGQLAGAKSVFMPAVSEMQVEFENKGYKAVMVNFDDLDFLQIHLDPHSVEFFENNLQHLKCELSIMMILHAMEQMVLKGALKSHRFINMCLKVLPSDLSSYTRVYFTSEFIYNSASLIPFHLEEEIFDAIYQMAYQCLYSNQDLEKNIKNILINLMVGFGNSKKNSEQLYRISRSEDELNDKTQIILKNNLNMYFKYLGNNREDEALQTSLWEDINSIFSSDYKSKNIIKIKAMLADRSERKQMWEEVFCNPNRQLSYIQLRYAGRGFNSTFVPEEWRDEYFVKYFQDIESVLETESKEIGRVWINMLQPSFKDLKQSISCYQKILENEKIAKNDYFTKNIKMKIDKLKYVNRVNQLYA